MTSAALSDRLKLIVITDAELAYPRSVVEVARDALRAGAPAIQLRDKRSAGAELFTTGWSSGRGSSMRIPRLRFFPELSRPTP